MTSCPSAEFTSIVESFRVSRAQHVYHGLSFSIAPPLPPPSASDVQDGLWIPTYSSPLVMGFPVFDPSHVGSEYVTPPSYHAPSSYHSHSFDRHSAPTPIMTYPAPDRPASDTPAADPPPPLPPGRPPPCGTGGHIHPRVPKFLCTTFGLCSPSIGLKKLYGPISGLQSPELVRAQGRGRRGARGAGQDAGEPEPKNLHRLNDTWHIAGALSTKVG
ncbi:hypothetical protein PIB30_047619 [Stylosanthes scabra]|uniref:Uncharacterized protein n=1 Tax=Stylosanthes scabra TaxID=79078 RepID=A0ABU6RHE4_9FABA|nr:hypothetical protein [Stylosanthes scabra]